MYRHVNGVFNATFGWYYCTDVLCFCCFYTYIENFLFLQWCEFIWFLNYLISGFCYLHWNFQFHARMNILLKSSLNWLWDEFGINSGWIWNIFEINLGWIWNEFEINVGRIWDKFGINLGCIWGEFGMNL